MIHSFLSSRAGPSGRCSRRKTRAGGALWQKSGSDGRRCKPEPRGVAPWRLRGVGMHRRRACGAGCQRGSRGSIKGRSRWLARGFAPRFSDATVIRLGRIRAARLAPFVARGAGTIVNISSVVGIAVEMLNGVYSASKSYVLSFGHTLQRDLAGKGVRVQSVLPAATATEFWDVAGYAKQKEAASTMTAEDLVDAALVGLDAGELVTIPTLHDGEGWTRWEADRRALAPQFANAKAAPRYVLDAKAGA
ncbi:MAG: SDR family NAD(P)-dependent oxidoreductase [Burkholderia gladioli]|uniref:SDR family NAD(P)-dependent oxidoreductase n=3 Tax=Burkholderia gladioli TaxID=28095 RepID=UPI00310330A3